MNKKRSYIDQKTKGLVFSLLFIISFSSFQLYSAAIGDLGLHESSEDEAALLAELDEESLLLELEEELKEEESTKLEGALPVRGQSTIAQGNRAGGRAQYSPLSSKQKKALKQLCVQKAREEFLRQKQENRARQQEQTDRLLHQMEKDQVRATQIISRVQFAQLKLKDKEKAFLQELAGYAGLDLPQVRDFSLNCEEIWQQARSWAKEVAAIVKKRKVPHESWSQWMFGRWRDFKSTVGLENSRTNKIAQLAALYILESINCTGDNIVECARVAQCIREKL
jgi:hypothetical protein